MKSLPLASAIAAIILAASAPAWAGITISDTPAAQSFPIAADKKAATIFYDADDAKVVEIAAGFLALDIQKVTGVQPAVRRSSEKPAAAAAQTIFLGTLGHTPAIDAIIKAKNIDVSAIQGKWESYIIVTVENPMPGVQNGLMVIGSDRRGTAFGVFEISEKIGVSPWNWWADVPTQHHDELYLSTGGGPHIQGPPSVKYRGIFINDEDWGMQPWAAKTFEPETKDIGPKTYAKIFELLLRLHANFMWPAMHDVTKAFNIYPQNKIVADDYAIVMGSSHCEPMLRNNVSEWTDAQGRVGQAAAASFNWVSNSQGILDYWKQRVQDNGKYENVYTLGLRGIHDGDMAGGGTVPVKAQRLNEIIKDQRDMLKQFVNPDVAKIPQIFCPYKEVLNYYNAGAVPPEDVTLVWADDNHGYIRQLSTPAEQKRAGGAGVYYHISYWGAPHDYLWLESTPPALIWEELSKAYDYGARSLWILNVGDLKPGEIGITMFLKLAYDSNSYTIDTIQNFNADFAKETFGPEHAAEIGDILTQYYQLNYQRKPEHLGFNTSQNPTAKIQPTQFTDAEIAQRLAAFSKLLNQTNALFEKIPKDQRDAFYELVVYPVRGSALQNQKILCADMNHRAAAKGQGALAAGYAEKSKAAYDAIQTETAYFNNTLAEGKWKNMMSDNPHNQDVFKLPAFAQAAAGAPATPAAPEPASPPPGIGAFIDVNGVVSIDAEHFTRKIDRADAGWKIIPGLGRQSNSVAVYPTTTASIKDLSTLASAAPALEYDFTTTAPGASAKIIIDAIPTHRINPERTLRYAVAIDAETPKAVDLETPENNAVWSANVLQAAAIGTTTHNISPGKHTLHLYMVDPGLVIEHVTIDLGGLEKSYLPPPETRAAKP